MIMEIAVMTWPIWAVIAFALLVMSHLLRAMRAPARPQQTRIIDAEFEVVEEPLRVDILV